MGKTHLNIWLAGTAIALVLPMVASAQAQAPISTGGAATTGESGVSDRSAPPSQVQDVIVTAQKRQQRLQDIPFAITVVSGDQLARQNITSETELQYTAPELNYAGEPSSGYSIRGSGTQTFTRSAENNVSVVVDGVVQGQLFAPTNSLFDIQRVEVLSGPQGMLFGKNASAGVISITTNAPDPHSLQFIGHADVGEHGYQVYQGVANLPIGQTNALRLNVFSSSEDGLFRNDFSGKDVGAYTNAGVRARLLLQPNDAVKVNVIADYEKDHGGNFAWTSRIAGGAALNGLLSACGVKPSSTNTALCVDGALSSELETYGLSNQIDWSLNGGYTVTSITSDRQVSRAHGTDSDTTQLNLLDVNTATDRTNQFSQELRLASPSGGRIEYVAGLFFFNYNYKPYIDQAGTLGALPFAADRANVEHVNQFNYAAFGQATIKVTDQFNIILGGRETKDVLSAKNQTFVNSASGVGLPGFTPPAGIGRGKVDQDNFSYRIGAQYSPSRLATFFVTYTRGYKGPALQDPPPGTTNPGVVNAETPLDLEFGFKSSLFDRKLELDVTGYHEVVKNFQAQTVVVAGGLSTFVFANASRLTLNGVQANAYWRPVKGLTLNGGLLYNDAEYGDFLVQCNAPYLSGCALQGGAGQVINAKGRQLAGAPKWKLTASIAYEHPVNERFDGFVALNANWRDDVNQSATPNPNLVIKSYGLVDGRIGLRTHDGRYGVAIFAKNLFDKRFPTLIFRDPLQPTSNYDQAFTTDSFRVIGVSFDARY